MDDPTKIKLKRRIIDYLHKYATVAQLIQIARVLGVEIERDKHKNQ